MHDEDSGSAQQGGWQPPEYVSPWLPVSGSPQGDEGANDTISYRGGPVYDASQGPAERSVDTRLAPATARDRRDPATARATALPRTARARAGSGGPAARTAAAPRVPAMAARAIAAAPDTAAVLDTAAAPAAPVTVRPVTARTRGAGTAPRRRLLLGPASAGRSPTSRSRCSRPGPARAWRSRSTTTPPPPRSPRPATPAPAPAVAAALAARGGGTETNPFGGSGFGGFPSTGNGDSGGGGDNSGTGSLNASALAAKVDPGLVDVTSDLKYSGATAEGTGMVISSTGLVLTNNHVIDQSTSVSATLVTSGRTYTAKVIGYNSTNDVALLQLVGASGLKTVSLSNSNEAKVGEAVLALGNAGGKGGLPSPAQGTIQAINQSIKASDQGANTTESLHGMLETDAPIQEGDSGGPLVNGSGQVVGMDTAASAGASPRRRDTTATQGFAIPINTGDLHRRRDQRGQGLDHRAHRPGRLHRRQRRRRRLADRVRDQPDRAGPCSPRRSARARWCATSSRTRPRRRPDWTAVT